MTTLAPSLHILMPNAQSTHVTSVIADATTIIPTIQAQVEAFATPIMGVTLEQYCIIYDQRLGEHGARYKVLPGYDDEHSLYGEIDNYYVDRHVGAPHQSEVGSMVWVSSAQWDAYQPF